jgi:hypothetical protein
MPRLATISPHHQPRTASIYDYWQFELIRIQKRLNKKELNTGDLEAKFLEFKSRPEVKEAIAKSSLEVESIQRQWKRLVQSSQNDEEEDETNILEATSHQKIVEKIDIEAKMAEWNQVLNDFKLKISVNQITEKEFEAEFSRWKTRQEVLETVELHPGEVDVIKTQYENILDGFKQPLDDEPKSPLSLVNPFPMTDNPRSSAAIKLRSTSETSSIYDQCQSELIDLQTQFKKRKLSLAEVESRFNEWKSRPEVKIANESHRHEVENMKREWERVQSEMRASSEAKPPASEATKLGLFKGTLKRIKMRRNKSRSDLETTTEMKYSTLPSKLPSLKLKKLRSVSTTSIGPEAAAGADSDQDRHKSMSLSESGNFSDSSWSAETSASFVDSLAASLTASERPQNSLACDDKTKHPVVMISDRSNDNNNKVNVAIGSYDNVDIVQIKKH